MKEIFLLELLVCCLICEGSIYQTSPPPKKKAKQQQQQKQLKNVIIDIKTFVNIKQNKEWNGATGKNTHSAT